MTETQPQDDGATPDVLANTPAEGATPQPDPKGATPDSSGLESALKREREAHKAAEKKALELQKKLDDATSSNKTVEQRIAELEQAAAAAERQALVLKVASELGLSAQLADRIRGDDEAAIRQDAEALKSLVPQQTPTVLNGVGGPQGPPAQEKSIDEWRTLLRSRH